MKKWTSRFAIIGFLLFGIVLQAQSSSAVETIEGGFLYTLKEYFVNGGPVFMALPTICLILGLAFSIERIIFLNLLDINPIKFLKKMEDSLSSGGVEEAKNVSRDTKGPVASIAYQALSRLGDGQSLDDVEKSVIGYGGVEIGKLERNLSWIALFIAIAPMLGFLGTVIGMVEAFKLISESGAVDPTDMAGKIQLALLTTLAGLVVAIILQVFYNYITAKIDSVVNKMEDASISIMDTLVKYKR